MEISLKKDRFAHIALAGWLIAVLSLPVIIWAYPQPALAYSGVWLVSVLVMILLNRIFILKVKRRYVRVILQIALLAIPVTTNILIAGYRFHYNNPSWLFFKAYGDDKPVRFIVWNSHTKNEMQIYQSGLYWDRSWFFIPGRARLGEYKKDAGLALQGLITEIKNDTVNLKSFDRTSASVDHTGWGASNYRNVRFLDHTFDTALIRGRIIQFTVLKFVPGQDTGCINNSGTQVGQDCYNTGELQIGNAGSLGLDRTWLRQVLDTALKDQGTRKMIDRQ